MASGFRDVGVRVTLRPASMLDDIITYLVAQGIGVKGQNLFTSHLPDAPDQVVVVFEYPGRGPDYALGSGTPVLRRPRIQIMSRAKSYKVAKQKAEEAYLALSRVVNQTLGSARYEIITPLDEPGLLNRDESARSLLVFNCEVNRLA